MPRTRSGETCPVFGIPERMKPNVLPTCSDVMRHYLYIKQDLEVNKKWASVGKISSLLMKEIKKLWEMSSIPTISNQHILVKIRKMHKAYRNVKKNVKITGKLNQSKKVVSFRESAEKDLFDICICKCNDLSKCTCKVKVPVAERAFLADQRTFRRMGIGSIDVKTTQVLKKRHQRKVKAAKYQNTHITEDNDKEKCNILSTSEEATTSNSNSSKDTSPKDHTNPSTSQLRTKLPNVALACDRTGVSDRSAAILINSALKDMGIISKNNSSKVVDRSKIRRERTKTRSDLKMKNKISPEKEHGLYFDGRKDRTLIMDSDRENVARKTIIEEHIVLVSEPGSKYLGHITPITGSSQNVKKSLVNFIEKNIDITKMLVIGCDGAVVNTGLKNGIIKQLELFLGHPVHWFICLLHTNELPLRHLLQHIDGKTTGPKGYRGEIGKQLEHCEKLPLANFEKIDVMLPDIDSEDLSTDQRYLYEMVTGISKKSISLSLSQKDPGKLNHSRWLTTANRILRLYISIENPSENLKLLTKYVVTVYTFVWFNIKAKPSCRYGSIHLFNLIKASRFLPEECRTIIEKTLQRNAFYAHPENIILATLGDSRENVRELAVNKILESRVKNKDETIIREFKIPKLNFNADDYIELIDWESISFTEPPLTMSWSEDELKSMIKNVPDEINIFNFPCHSQAVERCVKLVTEASMAVCGTEERDGFIHARITSRSELPVFETKNHYYPLLRS